MPPLISLLVGVLAVLGITMVTAYFVAQEFSYMAVDRAKLHARADRGDKTAARTLAITRRTSFMLSGAQLGITVTGLLVGYVAEPLIGQAIGHLISGENLTAVSVGIGGFIALTFSTLVQMLFGELFPKNYSIARADDMSGRLARSTQIYLTVFGPLIAVFDKAAELLLRALRIEPVHDVENIATASDLVRVVELSRDSGQLSPELSTILDRILDFPQRDVGHAMQPRTRVDTLRDTTPISHVRELMATDHTRYPVLTADESVVGIAHLVDVLGQPAASTQPIRTIAKPAVFLPETLPLPLALQELRSSRQELACVMDEYGGFAGILTLEDLAEEIVGELDDEHDPEVVQVQTDGLWEFDGDQHVDEVERIIDADLPQGDYETIGGLVIYTLRDLPQAGATVEINLPQPLLAGNAEPRRLRIEVLSIAKHVPARVRVSFTDAEAGR